MAWLARRKFRVAGAPQHIALLCVPHVRLSVHVRPPILNAPMPHAGKARAGNAPMASLRRHRKANAIKPATMYNSRSWSVVMAEVAGAA